MAQFGRPSTDTFREWEEDDGTTTDIFDQIDETSFDDADYIRTPVAPTSDVYVTKLTTLEDPQVSTGHVVRYRYRKDTAGGAQIDLTVQLRQGYVNEGTPGTQIAAWTHTNIAETIAAAAQTLSGAEADAITVYTDLYLRFVGNQV
jgi:hypothetical protein